jgi:hypothetical protein
MTRAIRSSRLASATFEIVALLCLFFVLTGCKSETPPSTGKAPERKPLVELRANDREAFVLVQARPDSWREPQRDRADHDDKPLAVASRSDTEALEGEERLLLEAIMAARAGSALAAETENLEKAERAFCLATDRYLVGTGTPMDVLNAQTALAEARGSYIDALRIYARRASFVRTPDADHQN